MVLPSSGAIDLNSIQTEFGGTSPIGMNEYYRNGTYVPSNGTNNSIPIDGSTDVYFHPPISFSNFYNASSEYVIIISVTTTNVNLQTLFNATYPGSWASSARKRLIINSGVIVGSTSSAGYALNIPSAFGGTVIVDNFGSILGAGGLANSGTGGNAIFAGASGISINNQGAIYAGGGGGGQGGTGGTGTAIQTLGAGGVTGFSCNACNSACIVTFGSGAVCASGCFTIIIPTPTTCTTNCTNCQRTVSTAGGAGGAGGIGQGYNQTNANGVGGAAGGTNAGTGGTGGNGGTWGASATGGGTGSNGNVSAGVGGAAGGLAGFYIVGNSNVSWISTGSVAGRVG